MNKVGICNMALGWLGARKITQLDEVSPLSTEEELCARFYDSALDAVLEARAWTFATKRITAGPAASTGLADFPSKYPIPSTVVRVLSCDDGGGSNLIRWRREGDYILTETSPTTLYAKVVANETDPLIDPLRFPPGFARAVAARLAADLAVTMTENVALARHLEEKAARELALAGRYEGIQGTSELQRSDGPAASARW